MVDFDYDPDDLIEEKVEEELETAIEDELEVDATESESIIEDSDDCGFSSITGAAFGVGIEVGREDAEDEHNAGQEENAGSEDSDSPESIFENRQEDLGRKSTDVKEGKVAKKRVQVGEKRNVSPGAKPISKSLREEGKKKRKLDPFEQWVADVIAGRKVMDDEL